MGRLGAAVGSIVFFFVAPGTVAGLGPYWINGWRLAASPPGLIALQVAGAVVFLIGLAVVAECFARFATKGLGTPAPIAPTQHLVVSGLYRHVRNPMYVGVLAMILGQAALFADVRLVIYALAIWAAFHLFVVFFEEPTLRQTYGDQYAAFTAAVPRWIPRRRPAPLDG
jgi:protein-S-isoprenylcysteine O-methyltransferase Ste14